MAAHAASGLVHFDDASTQDGLVVFKDVCTKEVASAPIGNTQVQLQLPAPQQGSRLRPAAAVR